MVTTHTRTKTADGAGRMDQARREQVLNLLYKSYHMEIETVCNYLANAIHLDGLLAKEVRRSLDEDITEELGHARKVAERIKILGGRVPGSKELTMSQDSLQPPEDSVNVRAVIEGVIEAENAAIEQYQKIIEVAEEADPVTHDLCISIKADEEEHWREFVGYLRGLEAFQEK